MHRLLAINSCSPSRPFSCTLTQAQNPSITIFPSPQYISSLSLLSSSLQHPHLPSPRKKPHLITCTASPHHILPRPAESASLYSILGLQHDVSQAEIKSAYRQMARRYHPDCCPSPDKRDATERFIQVQKAYETLSDPERRADYDYNLLHPFCAQALGRGFGSNMTTSSNMRKHRDYRESEQEVSIAWKLQWEAQLSTLRLRHQEKTSADLSWGARMRRENCSTCF